ncbi:hypothetical protein PhCBS80983_g05446 [Powellomyces hirtus]|uniref:Histone acetyltransferase n=1 Tax=Powellomyces hirtus TaxID=109895 RepID=A0A507DVR2_9FUNG|nr:hypothetical protein PhCBS80983_g05446 [Powellomyces hirtus]
MLERPSRRIAPTPITPREAASLSPNLIDLPTRSRSTLQPQTPATHGRAGRRSLLDSPATFTPATPSPFGEEIYPTSEAPAEEKSYRDFFPDLEITKPLPILTLPTDPQTIPYTQQPSEDVLSPVETEEQMLAKANSEQTRNQIKEIINFFNEDETENPPSDAKAPEVNIAVDVEVLRVGSSDEDRQSDLPPSKPSGEQTAGEDKLAAESVREKSLSIYENGQSIVLAEVDKLLEQSACILHGAQSTENGIQDSPKKTEGRQSDWRGTQTLPTSADTVTAAQERELSSAIELDVLAGVEDLLRLPDLPPAPPHLPKPMFRMLPETDDNQTWTMKKFRLGAAYIRHVEPSEDELALRVEYDMDEQDYCWLNIVNEARKKDGQGQMDQDYFEKVMDILEKEWFDLTKDIPSPRDDEEDPVCAVCDDGECENSNAIVFCDGCNIAVHQDCYGIPYIPEGQWLCRKCMLSPHKPVDCVLCPHADGAFKQTSGQGWAHLLCAMWVPECNLGNFTLMEPVVDIEKIPRSRWKLTCYLCQRQVGAPIQCSNKSCYTPFHATCARKAKLYMKMRAQYGTDHNAFRAFCDKHTPPEYREKVDVEASIKEFKKQMIDQTTSLVQQITSMEDSEYESAQSSGEDEAPRRRLKRKTSEYASDMENEDLFETSRRSGGTSSRKKRNRLEGPLSAGRILADLGMSDSEVAVHAAHQFSTPVVIPEYILKRVLETLREEHKEQKRKGDFDRKIKDFVILVCKYWSLKRESRRGAPLLKRLHLEPWTASASALKQDEEARAKRNQTAIIIRQDLERVRLLAELIRKREKEKMRQYRAGVGYTELIFFPFTKHLRPVFEKIRAMDRDGYFQDPVTPDIAPDYATYVKTPMDFTTMARKVDNYEYKDVTAFETDLELIWGNCMVYNKAETEYFKAAARYQRRAKPLVEELRAQMAALPIDSETGVMNIAPTEFLKVLWSNGWPEGMAEKPLFPKEVPKPAVEEGQQASIADGVDEKGKAVIAADFVPFRMTRARLAAIAEAVPETPKPKRGSAKKKGTAQKQDVDTKAASAEPVETPTRSRRGKAAADEEPAEPTKTSGKGWILEPILPEENEEPAIPAVVETSLDRVIRPARKAAEMAQKAVTSLASAVKRAPVSGARSGKKPPPVVAEPVLTGREARALKRRHGNLDTPLKTDTPATPTPQSKHQKTATDKAPPTPLAESSAINTAVKAAPSAKQGKAAEPQATPKKDDGDEEKASVPRSLGRATRQRGKPQPSAEPEPQVVEQEETEEEEEETVEPETPVGKTRRGSRATKAPPPPLKEEQRSNELAVTPANRPRRKSTLNAITPAADKTPKQPAAPTAAPATPSRRKSSGTHATTMHANRRCSSATVHAEATTATAWFGAPVPPELDQQQDLDDNPTMLAFIEDAKPAGSSGLSSSRRESNASDQSGPLGESDTNNEADKEEAEERSGGEEDG